ncbi:EscU/YscU/HrcU family type III secretion system export apparatus switch protein [Paramaledivibacter caminithermalis]|jgi:FlhB-like protein|uniref:Flagellar biosynthesis protein n=1 Tax=Paramaledivibacter caminithermalis (strain DSM 15212 / CIP 107654 / DViRD3) TaxID=1121301 RepID=A0A1M6NKA8_PARC5|nr:EscU/YscU/HrcU family type III secretion system export apparatus switch protein [Paramaledivibacter caminithermalis]SHJ96147.1 flagellar biosynthesis protein [Paramaledivibacter caminithermalis DSM 15212]
MKKKVIANALKYNSKEDIAPKVIAKGMGLTAEKIKDIAKENNIPIYKDDKLSKQLYNLSIGEEISPELYNVVAEVLTFIARLDNE